MQKSYAWEERREDFSKEGTEEYLSVSNIKLKVPCARRLLPRWVGPLKILKKVAMVEYKL